jgi:putative FmdB family regulatory protein
MPLYDYEVSDGKPCAICKGCFELRRPVDAPPLEACPLCRRPVRKKISTGVATPKVAKPFSVNAAKNAGFTVLERKDKGVYERQ